MSALFAYPKQAEFGRVLPKNKIYEHSGANTRLKDLFVEQVDQIVWRYKLAPETINLVHRFRKSFTFQPFGSRSSSIGSERVGHSSRRCL